MRRELLLIAALLGGCLATGPVDDDDAASADDDDSGDDDDSAPVDADGDGASPPADCDDSDPAIHPSATEVCDPLDVDEDCDGAADDDDPEGAEGTSTVYLDGDGDGVGDASTATERCDPLPSMSAVAGDCDDTDAARYPGAPLLCDGLDNDCDGVVTDGGLVTVPLTGATFTSIQDALDAAPLGQEVIVCAGTYAEALSVDRAVLLGSLEGRDTTILAPPGDTAVAISVTADSSLIDGFTVLGGDAGLIATGLANLTVRSTTFSGPEVGPGIDLDAVTGLILTDVHVLDSAGAGVLLTDVAGTAQDLVVGRSAGTGVAITDSTVTLEDAVIENNSAPALAGGVAVSGGAVTILDSEIRDNSAPTAGGLLVAGAVTWTDGELLRNTSTSSAALGAVAVTWSLTLDSVDGGTGADDNSPADLAVDGQALAIPAAAITCVGPDDPSGDPSGCQ